MKRVLITGANSYIGTSVENWLLREPDKYLVDTLDMEKESWYQHDFSKYDVVFHVAGIAHVKETSKNRELYYKVNRDLAVETARKIKAEGVGYFIFLSSMSVYGVETGTITKDSKPNPKTAYGKSKLEAEKLLTVLSDDDFKIAILRPPMVYGKGCKGNYQKLAKLAKITPIFPKIDNQRSMIYIDNLSEFVKLLIDDREVGLFFPQNKIYINTCEIVQLIANSHGRKIRTTKIFNPIFHLFNIGLVNKIFGSLVYEMNMSQYKKDYRIYNHNESFLLTEKE